MSIPFLYVRFNVNGYACSFCPVLCPLSVFTVVSRALSDPLLFLVSCDRVPCRKMLHHKVTTCVGHAVSFVTPSRSLATPRRLDFLFLYHPSVRPMAVIFRCSHRQDRTTHDTQGHTLIIWRDHASDEVVTGHSFTWFTVTSPVSRMSEGVSRISAGVVG